MALSQVQSFKLATRKSHFTTRHAPRRRAVVVMARAPIAGKKLDNRSLVMLGTAHKYAASVTNVQQPGADLNTYMHTIGKDFTLLKMPLGASLRKVPTGYEIVVPKIQLFDVWFQPRALATVSVLPDRMELQARQCLLDGSHHVKDLKLNDVFNLDVKVAFVWNNNANSKIMSTASIDVDVAVPFPFSAFPRPVLEATGNTAFAATLSLMLNGFVNSLVGDYAQWSQNAALRESRAKVTAQA